MLIIYNNFKTFHFKIDHVKTVLKKNTNLPNLIDLCIKSFLNKLYTPEFIVQNVPKRNVLLSLFFRFNVTRQSQKPFHLQV